MRSTQEPEEGPAWPKDGEQRGECTKRSCRGKWGLACRTLRAPAFILHPVGRSRGVFRGQRGTTESTFPDLHFNTINLGAKWPAGDRSDHYFIGPYGQK